MSGPTAVGSTPRWVRAQGSGGRVDLRWDARRPRWLMLFLLPLLHGLLGSAAFAQGRRFALLVGENRGVASDELLRFAEVDAQRVRDVLVEVGGVGAEDAIVLAGADAAALRRALSALSLAMVKATAEGPNDRLYVYVSSHAKDGLLHLAGTELPLQELVDFVKRAPVRVGLLVVDACESGVLARLKGLSPREGSSRRVEASGVEGRVLISASGADEYAQESEALGGSTFTHHLVTGLRGAADASRDGRVTLEEAYAWAWARTIEATFGSVGGVQRPAYSVELSGQGQLVLSEPVAARARLTLDVAAAGRWLVVAASSGMLVAEVDKGDGPVSLALAPGRYVLRLRTARGLLERGVSLAAVGEVVVRGADLERASLVSSARKGDAEGAMAISLGGCVSSGLVRGLSVQPGIELRLRRDAHLAGPLNQFVLSLQGRDGAARDGSFHQTEVELRIGVAHRFVWSRASLATGVELGPLLVAQSLLPNATSRTGLGLAGAAALELRARLSGPVEAHALATAGGALLRTIVSGAVVAPRVGLSLGLVVGF